MHYAMCRPVGLNVLYIVICNTVRLIEGKVTLRDVISTTLCGFSHTNQYYEIFLR